jgi:hypothetical protein
MVHRVPATDKIRAAIGWQASLDLDVILADVIKHMQTAGAGEADAAQPEREARAEPSAASTARTASE